MTATDAAGTYVKNGAATPCRITVAAAYAATQVCRPFRSNKKGTGMLGTVEVNVNTGGIYPAPTSAIFKGP